MRFTAILLTGTRLKDALHQVKQITGWQPLHAYCDKGYRGVAKEIPDTEVHLSGKKKKSMKASLWKWYARRSAIEPIFGHLKSDNRLERNHLQGKDGDRINAILSGCGFNLRKLLRAFFFVFFRDCFGIFCSFGVVGLIKGEHLMTSLFENRLRALK